MKHRKCYGGSLRSLSGMAMAVLTTGLMAQQVNPPPAVVSDEVLLMSAFEVDASQDIGYRATNTISATRLNTPIRDLPFNLQVVTSEFLEDFVAFNVDESIRYSASVTPNPESREAGNYVLRGFSNARTKRNGFRTYYFHDFGNVDRVEVVKGPMSVFYGEAEPGGMINYITKRPSERRGGSVRAIVGSNDYYRAMAEVTGPLFKNDRSQLLYRVDLSYENKGTWRETLDLGRWKSETLAIGSQVAYTPFPNLRIAVEGLYIDSYANAHPDRAWIWNPDSYATWQQLSRAEQIQRSRNSQDWPKVDGSVGNGPPPHWNAIPPRSIADNRFSATQGYLNNFVREINSTVEARLPLNLSLRALLQYSSVEHESTDYIFGGKNLRASGAGVQGGSPFYILRDNSYFFGVLDLTGEYDLSFGKVRFVAGYEHNDEDFYGPLDTSLGNNMPWAYFDPELARNLQPGEIGFVPNTPSPTFPDWPSARGLFQRTVEFRQHNLQKSYYASAQVRLFEDRLWLLGGVRREEADILRTDFVQGGNRLPVPRETPTFYSATIPQTGVSFRILPSLSVFGSYSESFKRPPSGAVGRTPSGENFTLPPELGEGYDVGFKMEFLDGRLSGTVSYYDIVRTNVPRTIPQDAPLLSYTLLSDADTSKGWELDLIYQEKIASGQNQLLLSYSNIETATKLGSGVRRLDGVPNLSYAVWNKFKFTEGPLAGLTVGGGFTYTGASPLLTLDARFRVFGESYVLFDGLIGYETKWMGRPTSFTLTGKNLTSREHYFRGPQPGNPRHLFFSTTMRF